MVERRRLVAGFGVNRSECGWATTIDLPRYEIKRRSGEWESSYVGTHGRVQQLIVAEDHDEALAIRNYLNTEPHRAAAEVVETRGLPRETVDFIATVLEAAWRADGTDHGIDVSDLVWAIAASPPEAVEALRASLTPILAPTRPQDVASPWWSDSAQFPFAAVVFDLDQTLIDSSALPTLADRDRWSRDGDLDLIKGIDVRGAIAPHELPHLLAERGVPVGVATCSSRRYAERALESFGIPFKSLHAGPEDKARAIRQCAEDIGVDPTAIVVIGDDASDIKAARSIGATSLGAGWRTKAWEDRMQPDITIVEPALLLEHADWWRLSYLAEQDDLDKEPVAHAGSWITYGGLQTYALGRYFKRSSPRCDEFLSRSILDRKHTTEPHRAIARGVELLGGHVGELAAVDIVTSVPASKGELDRFASYREVTGQAFSAEADTPLREIKNVGSLKRMTHAEREVANKDRFAADPSVAGRRVLILDDVITSGSTLKACSEALREAGATHVSCVVFAGTQD